MRFSSLCMILALAASLPLAAGDGTLVVLNKSDHEAALVNPQTDEVLAKLPTGLGPHEVAVSPDGKTAFVTNYGAFNLFRESGGQRGGPGNTITVLDLEGRTVRATFDLGDYTQPHGIATSRDGSLLWVTVEASQAVLEIDTGTGEIRKAWKTGQNVSHMLVPTPDESRLYVANIGSGTVTVIDRTGDSVHSVPTGAGTEGIDISPDGREIWAANREANTLSIIDTATDRVIVSFESGGRFPIRLKFTPDGRQVWVSNAQSNSVAVFNAASRQLLETIEVGQVPVGIVVTPDGKRAYVANTNANQVTVIDIPGRRVLRSFTTGTEPDGMAWAQ